MNYLSSQDVLYLHEIAIEKFGGAQGVIDFGLLESAVAQPLMTFAGVDLYPTLADKAAILAFSLANNHPFIDGNKRTAHMAMVAMLKINGQNLSGTIDEHERVMLGIVEKTVSLSEFKVWIRDRLVIF